MFGKSLEGLTGLRVSGTEGIQPDQQGKKIHEAESGETNV